jgi:hypothetical protein
MFQIKVVEQIKTRILCPVTFPQKSRLLGDNVEKYVTDKQITDGNIMQPMRFACWKTKATETHSEYEILTAFAQQKW